MDGYAIFSDRREAGRQLADALADLTLQNPVILALPRGGVPVAYEVAKALGAPLDLLMVRKIGAPGHEEYGIGAVVDGASPQVVLNDEALSYVRLPAGYIEAETARQLTEIERRRAVYLGGRAPIALAGRTVVIVDDGVATGGTVKASVQAVRKTGAERIVLAVPVGAPDAIDSLRAIADVVVCLHAPAYFRAVGNHYLTFDQTSDEEVVALLEAARREPTADG
ncbi:MAG TPA: phosphoribosyltransferase [Methylomirabilota bacterium]|nr:phosphoribosyltransferase [Methylomirabilota bacterium]